MSMEMQGLSSFFEISDALAVKTPHQSIPQDAHADMAPQTQASMEKVHSELQKIAQAFDARLEVGVDRDLNRIVVKVIDTRTDKVIRELPPKAIQELYRRIREVVGLLFDHKA